MRIEWFTKVAKRKSNPVRWLRKLGPSWSASPLRRLAQASFFALFLALFFHAAWPADAEHFQPIGQQRQPVEIPLFLILDPLVSFAAAIASRGWVWSLGWTIAILGLSLLLPRMFCGYVCPLGTLIDLFDWTIGKRIKRFHLSKPGWWRNLRYYLLASVLAAALGGAMLSGYVAAIPTITRAFELIASPVQIGLARGWEQVPSLGWGHYVTIGIFAGILLTGLLRPRFWCRHLCPSGAVFSLASLLRLSQRKVEDHCTSCGKCARACSFDAINDDLTTTDLNCTFCQTCGGVCPVDAIRFSSQWTPVLLTVSRNVSSTDSTLTENINPNLSRRGFLIGAAIGTVGGGLASAGLRLTPVEELPPLLRPPGSMPEKRFTSLCVRCDLCLRSCPTGILQPADLRQGLDRLWTPWANADWAGCQPSCNNCGQVCPTGAIEALTLEQKKTFRMGLAWVNADTCLPYQGRNDCQTSDGRSLLCQDACETAGYSAIISQGDNPTPSVNAESCVGCGLCQAICYRVNVKEKRLLKASAIRVQPGPRRESTESLPSSEPFVKSRPAATAPAQPPVNVPYFVPD